MQDRRCDGFDYHYATLFHTMLVHRSSALSGAYALDTAAPLTFEPVSQALSGRVRFASGRRSPDAGMRTSAAHELGYVISGRLQIDTATESHVVQAGDILVMSPAESHSTTALEDSEIFFVLLEPHLAV